MNNNTNDPFRLSIDKISITFRDDDHQRIQRTGDRLIDMVESGKLPNAKFRRDSWYKLRCKIRINGENSLLLQIGARNRATSSYRVEYNPSKIGRIGRLLVRDKLDSIFELGGHHLLMAGKVTRIDAALDLNNLSVDEVLVRQKRMRQFTVVSVGGCPQTLYHGSSSANQAAIYDKTDGEMSVLRIERRLKPNCLGIDLPELKTHSPRYNLSRSSK